MKGIAGAATLGDIALVPVVNLAVALIDPLVAQLEAGIAPPGTAEQVVTGAANLLIATAPVIKVVPGITA